jgi:hypothetical protein
MRTAVSARAIEQGLGSVFDAAVTVEGVRPRRQRGREQEARDLRPAGRCQQGGGSAQIDVVVFGPARMPNMREMDNGVDRLRPRQIGNRLAQAPGDGTLRPRDRAIAAEQGDAMPLPQRHASEAAADIAGAARDDDVHIAGALPTRGDEL